MKRLILALAALSVSGAETVKLPVPRVSYHIERVSRYTAYAPHSLSACGRTRPVGTQLAASRDLFRLFGGCGARVRLTLKNGVSRTYLIFDVTNRRYSRTVDVLVASRAEALRLGITSGTLSLR